MTDENPGNKRNHNTGQQANTSESILDALERLNVLPPDASPAAAVSAVMCVLLKRLPGDKAVGLANALPIGFREVLEPCAINHEKAEIYSREEFVHRVSDHLMVDPESAEKIVQGVFASINSQLDPKMSRLVESHLTVDLVDLWKAKPQREIRAEEIEPEFPDWQIAHMLKDLEERGERLGDVSTPEGVNTDDAISAVLCVLSQRLSAGDTGGLMENLPAKLKPVMQPCDIHTGRSAVFDREEFVQRVSDHLNVDFVTAESITQGVFGAVKKLLPEHDIQDIRNRIPGELVDLWVDS